MITLCITWKLLIALFHEGKYGNVRKHADIFQAGLISINYMLCRFILELLFKINITLLQYKIVGMKEKKMLTFYSGNKPFLPHPCSNCCSHCFIWGGFFLLSLSLHPSDSPALCLWYNIYMLREIRLIFCCSVVHTGPGRMEDARPTCATVLLWPKLRQRQQY